MAQSIQLAAVVMKKSVFVQLTEVLFIEPEAVI